MRSYHVCCLAVFFTSPCVVGFYVSACGEQELANHGPWAKAGPPLVFVNKVLLSHNHAHVFIYRLGWLCASVAELSSCGGDRTDYKVHNVDHLAFFRSLQSPAVEPPHSF